MRKMLTCILLLIFLSSFNVFANVNTEIRNAFNYHGASTGFIFFEIWAIETSSSQNIYNYQDAIKMDADLNGQFSSVVFSNHRFSAHTFAGGKKVSPADEIYYSYTYNGTSDNIPTSWVKIVDVQINYTKADALGTITWSASSGDFYVRAESGGIPGAVITGTRGTIDAALTDFPLPVQVSDLSASFDGDDVELIWCTESEVSCFGFNVWRREVGGGLDYVKINSELIPGQGNTSSRTEYRYLDNDVQKKIYSYQVEEVSVSGSRRTGPVIVDLTQIPNIPYAFRMDQNFPNPFNPATRINYEIPEQTHVSLKVYNLMGNEVKTLVNEVQPAGPNSVDWNGTDNHGRSVGAGIYFYKIKAGDDFKVGKMTKLE